MQKVEGSSPFIRSQKKPRNRGFFYALKDGGTMARVQRATPTVL